MLPRTFTQQVQLHLSAQLQNLCGRDPAVSQVQALLNAPFLLDNKKIMAEFPEDVVSRAKQILTKLPGGVGAYQDSRGSPFIRQEIADFLQERDGYPANPEVSIQIASSHVACMCRLQCGRCALQPVPGHASAWPDPWANENACLPTVLPPHHSFLSCQEYL